MAAAQHAWRRGARLFVRGTTWRVLGRSVYGDCESLHLRATRQALPASRTILLPFDRPRLLADSGAILVLRPRAWLRRLNAMKADARPAGGLSAAAGSAISILPYQLEPALLMRRHGTARVMIADAVGLGKTIQAGLLLCELAAEHDGLRALVVVPAGLRDQWTHELVAHFGIETVVATSPWLARVASEVPHDVNPWALPGIYVASADLIKRPEVLRPLEDVTWDLVIVDEAHGASLGTARHAAVHAVACRARRVLLLTATPHAGDNSQFAALCGIGAHHAASAPIVMFRRSRADVAPTTPTRTRLFSIRLSPDERRMHRLLEAYTRRLSDEARVRGNQQSRLVAIVLSKRALSSAASLAASCLRRISLLEEPGNHGDERQLLLPLEDEDPLADAEPDSVLGGRGLADVGRERQLLAQIAAAAARASRAESKIEFLRRMIGRLDEPAIVFTEYRDTLERLKLQLSPIRPDLQILHGGMDLRQRERSQADFNSRCRLLIATDAASEGLNLHSRCRLVIHFELPWSPARLAQRTGRVDRIGQSRRVHEVLLVSDDTAERHVIAPLLARAARSRSSMPSARRLIDVLRESDVAAAVIDGLDPSEERQTGPPPYREPPAGLRDEAVAEAARLADLRHSHTLNDRAWDAHAGSNVIAASLRRADALAPGVYACYSIALASDGTVVHRELATAHCGLALASACRTAHALRTVVSRFRDIGEVVVRERLLQHYDAHIAHVALCWARAAAQRADRERSILCSLPPAATRLVQAGLFDQRAIRAAAARSHASALLVEDADRRIDALAAASNLERSVHLCALFFVASRPRR